MGFAMVGFILLADPDPQYDVDSLKEVPEGEFNLEKKWLWEKQLLSSLEWDYTPLRGNSWSFLLGALRFAFLE